MLHIFINILQIIALITLIVYFGLLSKTIFNIYYFLDKIVNKDNIVINVYTKSIEKKVEKI